MILEVHTKGGVESYDVDDLAERYKVISIGRRSTEVWNTIAIEDEGVDEFQCHLIGCVGGPWRLNHGQNRTDCPKGLRSDRLVPCNGCEGPCVGGRPKFANRLPSVPTLVNDVPVGKWGTTLSEGDRITMGDVIIHVIFRT